MSSVSQEPLFATYARCGEYLAKRLPQMKTAKRARVFTLLGKASEIVALLATNHTLEEACERLRIPESQAKRTLQELMAEASPKCRKVGTYPDLAPPLHHRRSPLIGHRKTF